MFRHVRLDGVSTASGILWPPMRTTPMQVLALLLVTAACSDEGRDATAVDASSGGGISGGESAPSSGAGGLGAGGDPTFGRGGTGGTPPSGGNVSAGGSGGAPLWPGGATARGGGGGAGAGANSSGGTLVSEPPTTGGSPARGGGGSGGRGETGGGRAGGTGAGGTGTGGASAGSGSLALSFEADIWPVFAKVRDPIFVYYDDSRYESCVTTGVCHGGATPGAQLRMPDPETAYGMLLDVPSRTGLCNGTLRVVAGDPDQSCLILFYETRLRDELDWVGTAEIELVRQWITQGARP